MRWSYIGFAGLAVLLAFGCSGGDKEEAARLKTELESAKAEIKKLREELARQQGEPTEGKVAAAKSQLRDLTKALDAFKGAAGEYPPALQALAEPQEGRAPLVAASALVDPWGQPYQYNPLGPENQGKRPDVWTVRPGGDGSATIGNWMAK
jgi:hypothetical protein